jgi:L-amino acid N-acyltransferase YncA
MEKVKIIDTNENNIHKYGMCGYKNLKQEGYRRKVEWIKNRYAEGMKYKILYSEQDGAVGGIEYIPGENAWRPVKAENYLFIHCIFIMKKNYKEKGYGELLLKECINDVKNQNMYGIAVVTRKGTWMAGKELFEKYGFETVDKAPPDFELLTLKFNKSVTSPKFTNDWQKKLADFNDGLTIFTSDQCPYTTKAIDEISQTAINEYGIKPKIIENKNAKEAQNSPCAFGIFCIVYEGKVVAEHPISNTRFKNIMNKILN